MNKKYPKINRKEMVNKMGVCPHCKQHALNYDAIIFEGDSCAYFPYRCKNCGLEGEEWYHLEFSGHNIYDSEGNVFEL